MAEYFPPLFSFHYDNHELCIYGNFGLYVFWIKFADNKLVLALQKTGQMTLSLYVIHLTIGMILMATLTNKHYTGLLEDETPTLPIYILGYSILFYIISILFSVLWSKKFKNGPLETLMRKIST